MAHTHRENAYNSTPFSTCCGVASMNSEGRPDDHCHGCGQPMTHDDDGLNHLRRKIPPGHCLMCGQKRGDPAVSSNCNC